MVKKQSTKSSLPIALSGIFIAVAGFNIGSRFKPTAQDPAAYGWWAGVVLVAIGVWLWSKRRGFAITQLRELATLMAVILALFGFSLTSIGVGQAHTTQDDGYNVTGGFLMFVGGLVLGTSLGEKLGLLKAMKRHDAQFLSGLKSGSTHAKTKK